MVSAAELAKALRAWQADHPVADMTIGLVPVVGQVYGAASTAAAYADPDAAALDRGLATAGMLPFGKAAGAVRKIAVGKKGMERLGDSADLIRGKWKGGDGNIRQELDDSAAKLNEDAVLERLRQSKLVPAKELVDFPELYRAYPEIGDLLIGGARGKGAWYRTAEQAGLDPSNPAMRMGMGDDIPLKSYTDNPVSANSGDVLRVLKHELTHAVQDVEGYKKGYQGATVERAANNPFGLTATDPAVHRYARDGGEIEARLAEYRSGWPKELREEIPFPDHYRAEKWRLDAAKSRDLAPLHRKDVKDMANPELIRMVLERLRDTK